MTQPCSFALLNSIISDRTMSTDYCTLTVRAAFCVAPDRHMRCHPRALQSGAASRPRANSNCCTLGSLLLCMPPPDRGTLRRPPPDQSAGSCSALLHETWASSKNCFLSGQTVVPVPSDWHMQCHFLGPKSAGSYPVSLLQTRATILQRPQRRFLTRYSPRLKAPRLFLLTPWATLRPVYACWPHQEVIGPCHGRGFHI